MNKIPEPVLVLDCAGRVLDLSSPVVMGILNTTPDSFSDGGTLYSASSLDLDLAVTRAIAMVEQGAAILDIGGESTRPGAAPVSIQQEMDRVLPLLERLHRETDAVLSVDTSSPELMREAAAIGAGMINDVRALCRGDALAIAAQAGLPVCLMHMQGNPRTMQAAPAYDNVVEDVSAFLQSRVQACGEAGIPAHKILLDPGFGFGKQLVHNLRLLRDLDCLAALGHPILVGLSRKSIIGKLINREVDERLPASIALAVMAAERGAKVIRTHDVGATVDALSMVKAVEELSSNE